MDIYKNIKAIADAKGISIYALEKQTKLPNGSIRRWGISYPSIDKVIKVAAVLNLTLDQIVSGGKEHDKK